jgi:WXG100 family type VII secretion target
MASSGTGSTASGTGFGVVPQDVANAASAANTTAGNVQTQLDTLQAYVQTLEDEWEGIASATFATLMDDYQIYANVLHQALLDIGSGLLNNFSNYDESEQQNINNLKAVGSSIPGSNFF